jgi:Fe-S-cluster-containing dehydrogenase component
MAIIANPCTSWASVTVREQGNDSETSHASGCGCDGGGCPSSEISSVCAGCGYAGAATCCPSSGTSRDDADGATWTFPHACAGCGTCGDTG